MTGGPDAHPRAPGAPAGGRPRLHVALVIKTNQGGLWILPQVHALAARGHRVTVVLPPGGGRLRETLEREAVPLAESPFDFRFRPRFATLRALARLRTLLRRLDPDVVFYHLYASALAARVSTVGLRCRRVHMVAGPLFLESGVVRRAERVLRRLDSHIICGSDFVQRRYQALGAPTRQLSTVPYGADTSNFVPPSPDEKSSARRGLGIAQDAFVAVMIAYVYGPKKLAYAGRGIKGHDVLLEAWRTFHAARPDTVLLMVGSGFDEAGERLRAQLRASYTTDGPGRGVVWFDTVDDVRSAYAAADVSVCPSLSENHGAALESGAMGLPVIVSDAGGLPETVRPDTGWLVPRADPEALDDALAGAYDDWRSGRLAARGQRARQLVARNFDQRASAERVAVVIERVGGPAASEWAGVPGNRTIHLFTEARLGRDSAGNWCAQDGANGADSWLPYLEIAPRVTVVARCCRTPGTGRFPLGDVAVEPLPYYQGAAGLGRAALPVARAVARAVRRADHIIVRVPGVVGTMAAVVTMARRRIYAVEVVGDPADVLRAGVLGRLGAAAAPAVAALYRWQVRRAAASAFVTRSVLQDRYPPRPGTPTAGIARVRLTDDDFAAGPRSGAPDQFVVLTIGSQDQLYKGHDVLLQAVAILRDRGRPVEEVIVVGDGRYHDELVRLARTLGLSDAVTFTGHVGDRATLHALFDRAALFALPSLTEGLPRALVEAMARGVPAVGSAVGGIPELLDARVLVPPGDPAALADVIDQLHSDEDLWRSQSATNRQRADSYRSEIIAQLRRDWLTTVVGR